MARIKILIFILFIPVLSNAQLFKGVGVRMGWTIKSYGWNNPDPNIYKLYTKASINEPWVGLYGEFFSKKHFSTMIEFAYRGSSFNFDYNTLDEHGKITGTETVENITKIVCIAVSEKLKYDIKSWSFYTINGFKLSFQTGNDIDIDFKNILDNINKTTFGYTGGIGSAKSFSKFRLSLDFLYEADFNKLYSSSYGSIRKSGFGFRVGLGFYNPEGDTK